MVSNEKSAVNYIEDSLYEVFPTGKQDVFTSFALEQFYRFIFLKKKKDHKLITSVSYVYLN